ncbi:MAG: hypothetical protein UY90_C0067G0006 [Candidatus Peregrinibacteria bacterium GW2011_GWA2_54_9]|nr:MAG: hypothetical protein UY90_C0067G0006 [Candidatus Peregrinibacteria bacterium GW2011_GWA2_54_9]
MAPRAQHDSPRILLIHPSSPFSLRENWLPILERMRTDWAQEIIELGREIKLVSIVLPMQPDEVLRAATAV